jgi:hypothetical protein
MDLRTRRSPSRRRRPCVRATIAPTPTSPNATAVDVVDLIVGLRDELTVAGLGMPITLSPLDEVRPGQLHADDHARRPAGRQRRERIEVAGPARPDTEPILRELLTLTSSMFQSSTIG